MLLSDTERVISASQALSSSLTAFPSLSEASLRQPEASTSTISSQQQQQQQPLKPYWEYLSFLFRRQPEPKPDQMVELSYRDYLQVMHMSPFSSVVLVPGLGGQSSKANRNKQGGEGRELPSRINRMSGGTKGVLSLESKTCIPGSSAEGSWPCCQLSMLHA